MALSLDEIVHICCDAFEYIWRMWLVFLGFVVYPCIILNKIVTQKAAYIVGCGIKDGHAPLVQPMTGNNIP